MQRKERSGRRRGKRLCFRNHPKHNQFQMMRTLKDPKRRKPQKVHNHKTLLRHRNSQERMTMPEAPQEPPQPSTMPRHRITTKRPPEQADAEANQKKPRAAGIKKVATIQEWAEKNQKEIAVNEAEVWVPVQDPGIDEESTEVHEAKSEELRGLRVDWQAVREVPKSEVPKGSRIIPTGWALTRKADGVRARLVVKDVAKSKATAEMFANTPSHTSMRAFLAASSGEKQLLKRQGKEFVIIQVDVTSNPHQKQELTQTLAGRP